MPTSSECAAQEAPTLEGLVVVDVVEGTAVASLPRMSAILSNRPPSFPSLHVALEWARHSGRPLGLVVSLISTGWWHVPARTTGHSF